ncbi:hypothetical protein RSAG8_04016, partial [Rhizoctonia solani AG-8 WAC10335]
MSKKRTADNPDTPYSNFNPDVAQYQFEFQVDLPASSPMSWFPTPESTAPVPSRPAKKPRMSAAGSSRANDSHHRIRSYIRRIDKTEAVMKLLTEDDHYRLGDFLGDIFDPKTYESLSGTSQTAISSWLKASSRQGKHPAQVVDAIYRHPAGVTRDNGGAHESWRNILVWLKASSRQGKHPAQVVDAIYRHPAGVTRDNGGAVRRAPFSNISPPSFSPGFASMNPGEISLLPANIDSQSLHPEQFNSREGLEELMVRGTLHLVDREAHILTNSDRGLKRSAGMTWDDLDNISRDEQEQKIRTAAPVMWAVLSTIAFARPSNGGQSSGIRDAVLAIMMAIFMLLSFRNSLVNFFQAALTVFLFSCNTSKLAYQVLGRMGISTAHSTLHNHLDRLGQTAVAELAELAKRAYECAAGLREGSNSYFMLVFDNNGTASTAILLEDVPPGAFDPKPYWDRIKKQARNTLTVDNLLDDIDPLHLENAGVGLVMRTLLAYVPSLPPKLRQEVEKRFQSLDGYAIHRLRLRKSITLSMGTSNINESTANGVSQILHDLVFTQMKMLSSWFSKILILVGGDQLTVDRLRKARCFRAFENNIYESRSWALPLIQLWHFGGDQLTVDRLRKARCFRAFENNIYESRSWALPLIQLWHMKVAYLRSIFKIHWFDKSSSSLFGLRQIKTVFEGMVLTATYTLLQDEIGLEANHSVTMLTELAKHFAPGSRYHNCTISDLEQLACKVYRRYMTTESFHGTLKQTQPQLFTSDNGVQDAIFERLERYKQDPGTSNTSNANNAVTEGNDQLLGNMVLFMRDAFIYLEMASAIPEGDIGRVFEVTKVSPFFFWGSNATNYGNELLELACGFLFEYPEKLKEAILNNWLVNPSGLAGHWQEGDFFQEHSNKAIKTVFNTKNSEWDSRFLRDAVSVNITGLTRLRDSILKFLGIGPVGNGKSRPDYSADINTLASHYLRAHAFILHPGRSQEFTATDMFHDGLNKLEAGALNQFLERTRWDLEDINPQFSQEEANDEEDEAGMEAPEQPLVVEDGVLQEEIEITIESEL